MSSPGSADRNVLDSPIQYIKGVGPRLAKVLSKKGVETIEDALYFLPRTYEDRRRLTPIGEVSGGPTTVFGKVISTRWIGVKRRGAGRFEAILADGTGRLVLTWFHAYPAVAEEFAVGAEFVAFGDVKFFQGIPQIVHPEYELVTELVDGKPRASFNFGRVVPVYSETEGLNQKSVRRLMGEVLKTSLPQLSEPLPEDLRVRLNLPSLRKSFVSVHFPEQVPEPGELSSAIQRIIFEEFFVLQLGLCLRKEQRQQEVAPAFVEISLLEKFLSGLPFPLTGDQKAAIEEIKRDVSKPQMMTRLVQGDVGAGKTVVAFASGALAIGAGYQVAMMAPTELLAQQHFKTAEKFLSPHGIIPLLVTHANSRSKEVKEAVQSGSAQFVIGTHALFQEAVKFHKLGLVIVDEQHRFGVEQRGELVRKAGKVAPHLLLMTATPIPRTLSLTLYGDLNISIIREKPAGRQPIHTRILRDRERPKLYQKIRETVQKGEQVYIIYPLVEASEKLELKSATEMYEKLKSEVFPDLSLTLVHGRMKGDEKDKVLSSFKSKKFQILVSTTVIEVGIDIPNATLMVIEHPERLGLSQLHQLRGRVGRGSAASECILVADKYVSNRLEVMVRTEDGFEIAEEDLKIRGPGEFLGTRQSGLPGFRAGHILRDATLLTRAREEALQILEKDPELKLPEHLGIRQMVQSRWKEKIERLGGG
jgi:ATP-dependent DNA helicase RecG